MNNYTPNQILTSKQAAACLGWSPAWLRIQAVAGNIKYIRPGARKMGFKAQWIADFLKCKLEEL